MYLVNLALDPEALDHESVVAFRHRAYGKLTEHYSIIVPSPSTMTVHLSDETTVYGVGGMYKIVQFVKMYKRIKVLLQSGACDVITTQDMYFLGLLGLYFARTYNLGLEVQVLGIEKLNFLRKKIARFVLKRAGVVRALSNRLKGRLVDEFGVTEDMIAVVPIYVDVKKLGLDMRTHQKEDVTHFTDLSLVFRNQYGEGMNFLTVSRLVPIKQIEMQINAVKELLTEFPNILLHIVGDGPDKVKLQAKVNQLKLTKHVIFHGYQTGFALGMFYLECDCFLLTSKYEGWGMVIIEAATAGMPIIMTDVGCAGELIIDEESGLVIPVGSYVKLLEAMRRIIVNEALRRKIAVGGLHALAQLPSFDTVLEQYKKNWELALTRQL